MLVCSKAVSIRWGNSNFARTVWRFWLTACKYVFLFKEFATDDSNVSFEQCRVELVCRFSDHKCRHGNVYAARCNAMRKKTVQVIIISNYFSTGCNKFLVYNGFLLFSCHCARTRHHNMVRGVTFPSHVWGIRPITTHWIASQSEHTSLLRTMSFVKIGAFQKGGA